MLGTVCKPAVPLVLCGAATEVLLMSGRVLVASLSPSSDAKSVMEAVVMLGARYESRAGAGIEEWRWEEEEEDEVIMELVRVRSHKISGPG